MRTPHGALLREDPHRLYPQRDIAGLSKFARLAEAVTRKLQVQERITSEIADILMEVLEPHGVMVVVEAEHMCMCARGVRKPGGDGHFGCTRHLPHRCSVALGIPVAAKARDLDGKRRMRLESQP